MAGHVPTNAIHPSFARYALDMRRERKITRLREYDYRQNGAYAITLCVYERRCAFGKIEEGEMRLNQYGEVAWERWSAIPQHHEGVETDEFVVMPNHVHGILFLLSRPALNATELRQFGQPQGETLSAIIGSYKSGVTRRIGELRNHPTRVWQSRFYEHIIRHDQDLEHQRQYILTNPSKWLDDELNPQLP